MEAMKRTYSQPSIELHKLNVENNLLAGTDKMPTGSGGLVGNGGGGGIGWLAPTHRPIIIDDSEEEEECTEL